MPNYKESWKKENKTPVTFVYRLEDYPELLYIIKSVAATDAYFVFEEDAYEMRPDKIRVMTAQEILDEYNIVVL